MFENFTLVDCSIYEIYQVFFENFILLKLLNTDNTQDED